MQFIDLAAQQQRIRADLDRRIAAVLDHGQYILGPEVREVESRLARSVGKKFCVSCASGTDALLMPLMALGIGSGDAVFVPSFTFVATAEVVVLAGATPVFVDVEQQSFGMSAASLEEAIAAVKTARPDLRPRAVIVVDLFGQPADYEALNRVAAAENLLVLEDAAQSFGAQSSQVQPGGAKACALAPVSATSFFPSKPLSCYGDGGAIFCDDGELYDALCSIRVHGQGETKYDNVRIGINGRFDTMQAAVLLAKLEIFDDEIVRRNRAAENYHRLLEPLPGATLPEVVSGRTSVWSLYTLRSPERDELLKRLAAKGVPAGVYYPNPLHRQPAYRSYALSSMALPVSEMLSQEVLSLPMHPYLTEEDQQRVADALLK